MCGIEPVGSCYSVSLCCGDVEFKELMVVACPADDKCFVAVRCEGVSSFRMNEDHSFRAERGQRCFSPVEGTVQFLVRGSSTGLAGGAEHIENFS